MVLPLPKTAIGFKAEYLDFDRGIRVGNLEENERITRILKLALEARHRQDFVTERYGRGVFWQWIGFLAKANRAAKPISSHISFGCSKFFVMVDREERCFHCGMQVERGYLKAPREYPQCQLQEDWDWHRLLASLRGGSKMEKELRRLVCQEGFVLSGGNWDEGLTKFDKSSFPTMNSLRKVLGEAGPAGWAGFQVSYPMPEAEVKSSTGVDLIDSMLAVFDETLPLMNACMQIRL